jgi:exodeoxyribonuclease VII small subunit
MAKAAANPDTEQTFESALSRLEAIVQQMDSPTLPLDQLITDYEEGVKLVKICQSKLKDAEQKIEIITRRAQGDPELAAFDPAEKTTDSKTAAGPAKGARLF